MAKRELNGYKERRGRQTLSDRETDYPDFTEEFGHLERDAILGVHHKNGVMTLVEHLYKLIITLKPEGRTACYIEPVINDWFYRMLRHLFKSIILDCGMAFSNWKTMSNQKGVSIQFTDPGTPSQRELNEHINGMLRKDDLPWAYGFQPSGSDIGCLSCGQADHILRTSRNYRTTLAVFMRHIEVDKLSNLF